MANAIAPPIAPTPTEQPVPTTVNVFTPQGMPSTIPVDQVQHAIQLGYRIPSPQEVQTVKDQQEYGSGIDNAIKAGAAGVARGATFGLSDQYLTKSGIVQPHTLDSLKKYQAFSSGLGELVGVGGSLVAAPEAAILGPAMDGLKAAQLTGDAAAIAAAEQAVAVAKATITTADIANPVSLVNKIGANVAGNIGAEASVLAHAADGALQGAAFGAGTSISEDALGDNTALNSDKLFANVGFGVLFGGGLGAAFGLGAKALRPKSMAEKLVNDIAGSEESVPLGADGIPKPPAPGGGTASFTKVSPEEFVQARNQSTRSAFISPTPAEDLQNHQLFVSPDGAGYALSPEGDIQGVFNNSGRKGAGQQAIIHAIAQGGKTLDAIDGFLPEYYNKFGFNFKNAIKWDDQYAPAGWNYETHGRPDIVFMEYPEHLSRDAETVSKRLEGARAEHSARRSGQSGSETNLRYGTRDGIFDWSKGSGLRNETPNPTSGTTGFHPSKLDSDLITHVKNSPAPEDVKKTFFEDLKSEKHNADEIRAAAKLLDAPVLESQVSNSKNIQDIDSMLSQSPTFVGVARQKVIQKGFDKAEGAIQNVLTDGSDLSLAEVGEALQNGVTAKIEAEKAPLSKIYNAFEKEAVNLDTSPRAIKVIQRNIEKIKEVRIGPKTAEGSFAKQVVSSLANVKNLDDLKTLISQTNRAAIGQPQLRYIAGVVNGKLKELEMATLEQYGERYANSIPGIKNEIAELFNSRLAADAKYRVLSDKLRTIGGVIGKKRINGPQDFVDFIHEMAPEKFANKLFAKENSRFLKFMSENFKEETDLLMKYKRTELLNKATVDGRVNPSAILREVKKMSPELKAILFKPEDINKLEAARTYLEALPKDINPSKTSKSEAYRRMYDHPFATAFNNATDFMKLQLMKTASKDTGIGGVGSAIQQTTRKINSMSRAIFNSGADATAAGYIGSKVPHPKITEKMSEYANNPEKMMAHLNKVTQDLYDEAPNHAMFLQSTAAKGVQFLNTKVPRPERVMPLSAKFSPSKQQIAEFNQYYQIVENPLVALHQVRFGTITPKTIEALQAVTPKLYKDMQQSVFMSLADHLKDGLLIPQKTKQALSLFLNQDLDNSTTSQAIMANQQAILSSAQRDDQEQQAAPGGARKPSQKGLEDIEVSGRYLTAQQKSAQRT